MFIKILDDLSYLRFIGPFFVLAKLLSSYIIVQLNFRLLEVHTTPPIRGKCVIYIYSESSKARNLSL